MGLKRAFGYSDNFVTQGVRLDNRLYKAMHRAQSRAWRRQYKANSNLGYSGPVRFSGGFAYRGRPGDPSHATLAKQGRSLFKDLEKAHAMSRLPYPTFRNTRGPKLVSTKSPSRRAQGFVGMSRNYLKLPNGKLAGARKGKFKGMA